MMTDIREGLFERLYPMQQDVEWERGSCKNEIAIERTYTQVDEILSYLHSQGVVRKVEGELPINPYSATQIPVEEVGNWLGYHKAQQDMAGYTLTEEICI